MNAGLENTALLIFSHTPVKESERKNFVFGGGKKVNLALAEQLLRDSLAAAKASGLPRFLVSTELQRGGTFGERLANAFEDIFEKGFERVIAIGSDTPDLQSSDIEAAAHLLGEGKAVFGPSADGGVYLIGLAKANWSREGFLGIAWETDRVQAELQRSQLQNGGQIAWLEEKTDIDGQSDLAIFLRKKPFSKLGKLFRSFSASYTVHFPPEEDTNPSSELWLACQLRAPPAA